MITSRDPVGDWTWGIDPPADAGAVPPSRAAEIAFQVREILARYELAVPTGKVDFQVRATSDGRDTPVDAEGIAWEEAPLAPGTALSRIAARADELQEWFMVFLGLQCPGIWVESGVKHRAEKLFSIYVYVLSGGSVVVTLSTYSDAWLTLDTREREQTDIHAANAPRLAAALADISALMGGPPDPGDQNRHAAPTETGFEDQRDEGTAFVDSWGTFEILARNGRMYPAASSAEDEYEVFTEHPVRYLAVRRGERVLGYLWVSVAGDAVGYEPRTAAGDEAFEAGARWVALLGAAHREGLTALAAFERLLGLPPEEERGTLAGRTPEEAPSLDALQDLSGRY
ncbi:hypothetical protein OG711_21555 [Streptomyces uncialis]|uniref:hypothetical protein n=1 Tax=Streptomyces uncialis TaxID=1048205 RepID=UPI002E36F59A|nr:hypothetical protein [Streptomyces uncialis]